MNTADVLALTEGNNFRHRTELQPPPEGNKPSLGPHSEFSVTWRNSLADRATETALGTCTQEQAAFSSSKHSPVLLGKNVAVNRGADGSRSDTDPGVPNRLLIPQLPSFPISAPDLRLEAEVPRPLSPR